MNIPSLKFPFLATAIFAFLFVICISSIATANCNCVFNAEDPPDEYGWDGDSVEKDDDDGDHWVEAYVNLGMNNPEPINDNPWHNELTTSIRAHGGVKTAKYGEARVQRTVSMHSREIEIVSGEAEVMTRGKIFSKAWAHSISGKSGAESGGVFNLRD